MSTGGFAFAEDPARPGATARLFWRHDLDGSSIAVEATPCAAGATGAFDLKTAGWPAILLHAEGQAEEALIASPQLTIRLSLRSGSLIEGPVLLQYPLSDHRLADRLAALARWDHLRRRGTIASGLLPRYARAHRWPRLIAALDAAEEGASLRETASRIFGEAETSAAWNDPSDFLKSRTRRLLAQAQALRAGGYREML